MITALFLSAVFIPQYSNCQNSSMELIFAKEVSNAPGYTNTTLAKGNVQFESENTKLFCDSALWFRDSELIRAYGKVQINQGDTVNLFCDSLHFDGKTNISKLMGNVRMRDNEYKLVTDSLEFDGNSSKGYYTNWATISRINQDLTLKSIKGYYYSNSKSFFFKDSVHLYSPDYELFSDTLEFQTVDASTHFHGPTQILIDSTEILCQKGVYYTNDGFVQLWKGATINEVNRSFYADSLLYYESTGQGTGFGNVNLYDSTENIQFLSNYLWKSANNDSLILTDNAKVLQFGDPDTLFLKADSIFHYQDTLTELKTSIAINDVNIINGDILIACDSAYFSEKDSILKLHKFPILWSDKSQMTADSITADYVDNEFRKMNLYENAMIVTEHKDSIHFDQIKGKFMTAHLDSGKIQKVYIESNAQTLYFVAETKTDSNEIEIEVINGMNLIDCNEIIIYFIKSEIENIAFIDQPTATYYPIDLAPEKEKFLKGFKWEIDRKPKRILIE